MYIGSCAPWVFLGLGLGLDLDLGLGMRGRGGGAWLERGTRGEEGGREKGEMWGRERLRAKGDGDVMGFRWAEDGPRSGV